MKNITKKLTILLVASAFVLSGCEQKDTAVMSKPETKTQQTNNSSVQPPSTNATTESSSNNTDSSKNSTPSVNNQTASNSNSQSTTETKASTPQPEPKPSPTPEPAKKENINFSASVSDPTPSKNERITINVSGPGGTFTGECHYKSKNTPISGKVGVPTQIDISRATAGFTVNVDIIITYNGNTYDAQTSFTPR